MLATSTTRLSGPSFRCVDQLLGSLPGVPEHRVGERREVEVVAEELLGRHRLGDLHQRAVGQNDEVERIGRLGLVELVGVSSALASGVSPRSEHRDESGPVAASRSYGRRRSGSCACSSR